jgi:FKBP-type peptidyl-prolyl cis-trans isomerase
MKTRFWWTTWGIVGLVLMTIGRPIMAQGEQTGSTAEITTASGLKYVDVVVGTGREAAAGNLATVHYTGWLTNGKKFDSSVDRRDPFSFPIGAGQRKLTIPPELGYGARGAGGVIPPNATLVFDVELLEIR